MHWSLPFIGLPYLDKGRALAGADCWGVVQLVYRGVLGIEIPSYDGYSSCDEEREIDALIAQESATPLWRPVDEAAEFDVLIFRTGRYLRHAGVFVEPGRMLHMVEEDCAKVQRFDAAPWTKRLTGAYRWHAR